jgi:hypothetical protein
MSEKRYLGHGVTWSKDIFVVLASFKAACTPQTHPLDTTGVQASLWGYLIRPTRHWGNTFWF